MELKKNIKIGLVSLVVSALLLGGCLQSTHLVAEQRTSCLPLQTDNELYQVARLPHAMSTAVIAMDFADDAQTLTAVYPSAENGPGLITTWSIEKKEMVNQQEISWIHPRFTRISTDGHILLTVEDRPTKVITEKKKLPADLVEDTLAPIESILYVWDISQGKLRNMILERSTLIDLDLSPDGQKVVSIHEGGANLRSTETEFGLGGEVLGLFEETDNGLQQPIVVTFAPQGQGYGYGLANGDIDFRKLVSELETENAGYLSAYWQGNEKPTALAFDKTGQWVAIGRAHSLEVRNRQWFLSTLFPNKRIDSFPDHALRRVIFDPPGNLLAITTNLGWQVRRRADLGLVMENRDQPTASVAFSDDGCLLAFGETNGAIQVWGVRR